MAIGDDYEIQNNKDIRYTGAAHGASTAGYYTVLAFHQWLQGLADDASEAGDDFMGVTRDTPSNKSFDTIINLINGYNIDATASEHLYGGSILQAGGADIWDGIQVIANQGMDLQIVQDGAVISNDFWNYNVKGTDDTSTAAAFLTDSTASWTTDEWAGFFIKNTTDGSVAKIISNTGTTITGTLYGGTNDNWDSGDGYSIVQGLNFSTASGYSHQFILKVRTAGADIDGRRLIGQTRVWQKTFSEFRIGTGTSRGNNVLALTYADDANNTTAFSAMTGSPFSTIALTTAGYNGIDVNNDASDEFYYSEWNVASASINQFYEYQKWRTLGTETTTIYGLAGNLLRGVTHEIVVDTPTGTFAAQEAVTWTGGAGYMLAIDSVTAGTKMWIQLTTGVAPTDGQTITGTGTVDVNVTVTERTLSAPYMGSSTGTAISGAYGFGVEALDLSSTDKVVALDNVTYVPPNNVTFTVGGPLVSGEDYVLIGPHGYRFEYDNEAVATFTIGETLTFTAPAGTAVVAALIDRGTTGELIIGPMVTGDPPVNDSTITGGSSGTTADVNGSVENSINLRQMTLNGALTGASVTSVVVNETIAADTPATGTIRIRRANGAYSKHPYSAWATSTFTITSHDFSTNNAADGDNVYISYIDKLSTGTTEAFTGVYVADRTLFIRVRDGGGTPIKTFESTGTLTSSGGSATAVRTSDA